MSEVTLSRRDRVAIVSLDDGKANAFRPSSLTTLEAVLDEVDASDAGAVVIAGRPGFFSGGLDLKALPALPPAERTATFARFSRLMLRLWTLDRPTVAALTGHALGGGAILALAADVRVGVDSPTAKVGLIEVAVGLPVPAYAVEMARVALSGATLVESVIHGRAWTLPEALPAGWVSSLHAPEAVVEAAVERASQLAALRPGPYASTKSALQGEARVRAFAGLTAEVERFIAAFDGRS